MHRWTLKKEAVNHIELRYHGGKNEQFSIGSLPDVMLVQNLLSFGENKHVRRSQHTAQIWPSTMTRCAQTARPDMP
eukprot:scaffold117031_cov37-Prasinocladus_malaysianus.AAC.1